MVRLFCCHWLLLPLIASAARGQDRPADNATAARIADGVEKARAGKLLDAIEQFQRVLDTAGDELVPVDQAQYTPARWVIHGLLARLPAEGVKLYRARVDGQAARRLDEAKKARNDTALNRLLADMFCAKATEEAILELARRAFERADFDDAERFWRMLLPAPADDDHLLRFPDPKTPPAALHARLAMVKLFRGERDEAKADLQLFREKFPNDAGLLAGKTGKYVETLTELFNDPTQTTLPLPPDAPGWPTFAGSPSRRGTNRARLPYFWPDVPAWQMPLPFKPADRADGPLPDRLHPRALAFYPVVAGGRILVADGARVFSFDPMTGKRDDQKAFPEGGEETSLPVRNDVRFTLTEADGIVYARLGPSALRAGDSPRDRSFIVALRPPADAKDIWKVLWRLDPPSSEGTFTHFEGAPLIHGGRLHVGLWRQAGAEMQAGVACYRIDDPDKAPDLVWQRVVGKAMSEGNGDTRQRHFLVTASGPNVVYNTNGGTVIALDAATGKPTWEYRYPRNERPTLPRYRDLCPPLADGGRIYAAPPDADRLLCLDAATGRLIWEREGVEVIHLLGVARGRLIATFGGPVRGIRGLNLWTGADSGTGGWTIHDDGGEGTFGRGLVTEEAVVWPTLRGLRFLDPADGSQLRSPIPGPTAHFPGGPPLPGSPPGRFGNLCYADGVLVVTTATEIWGFVSEAKKLGDRRKAVRDDADNPVMHAELARSLIDAGLFSEAEAEAAKAGDAKDRLRWLLAERLIRDGKRDEAKRLYEELAKGDGSFAAAGAARMAEICPDPAKQRDAWRAVFAKLGTVRGESGVPFPASLFAELRVGGPLVMRSTVAVRDPSLDLPIPVPSGPVYVRQNEALSFDPTARIIGSSRTGLILSGAQLRLWPEGTSIPVQNSAEAATCDGAGLTLVGSGGIRCFSVQTTEPIWAIEFGTELPRIGRLDRPGFPSAFGRANVPILEQVRLDSDGLSFVQDGRRIVRMSPSFDEVQVVSAPDTSTAGLRPTFGAGGGYTIAQSTAGGMFVRDVRNPDMRFFPGTDKPWPEPPPYVGTGRFLIPDDGSVFLFDAKAGKELARYTLPSTESLTGELPRFRIHQGDPLLIIDRNHGVELDRLRIDGLKRAWERSPIFVGRTLDDLAFAADRFFTAADGMLTARAWKDGHTAWEAPLPELPHVKWKLAVAPNGLLAYPAEAVVRQTQFDAVGEFRRAGWDASALLRAAGRTYDVWADRELPVLVLDPADGRLVQRLTFPAAGPAAGVAVTPKGVVVVTGKGSWTLTAR